MGGGFRSESGDRIRIFKPLLIQRGVDLLERHVGVAGDKDGVIFHPASGFGIEPRSVFALGVDDFSG